VIEVDSLADNLTRVNRTNHFVESGVTMAPGHHGDPKKPPRMLSPSNVLRRCVPCEKVRRKGSGKIGRKVGFCGGGVGPRLARRLALEAPNDVPCVRTACTTRQPLTACVLRPECSRSPCTACARALCSSWTLSLRVTERCVLSFVEFRSTC
jgi:hypothetical protein